MKTMENAKCKLPRAWKVARRQVWQIGLTASRSRLLRMFAFQVAGPIINVTRLHNTCRSGYRWQEQGSCVRLRVAPSLGKDACQIASTNFPENGGKHSPASSSPIRLTPLGPRLTPLIRELACRSRPEMVSLR